MQTVDDTLGVDVDFLELGGDFDVFEAAGPQDARVVDHHVESVAGSRRELANPLRHFIGIGDVEVPGDRPAAERAYLVGERLQTVLVDVIAADGVSVTGERQGGGSADSGGRTGDENSSVNRHTSGSHRRQVA